VCVFFFRNLFTFYTIYYFNLTNENNRLYTWTQHGGGHLFWFRFRIRFYVICLAFCGVLFNRTTTQHTRTWGVVCICISMPDVTLHEKKTHLHRDDHYNGHINIKKVHKDVVEKFERIEKVSPEWACGGARKAESRKPENQMTQVRVPSPILYMHHVGDICNRSINIEQNRPTSRCRRRLRRLDKNDI